jgi:hypothetical protein
MMNDKPKTNLLAKPPPVQGLDFARKQEAGVIIANNDKNDKRFTIEKYKPAEPLLPGPASIPQEITSCQLPRNKTAKTRCAFEARGLRGAWHLQTREVRQYAKTNDPNQPERIGSEHRQTSDSAAALRRHAGLLQRQPPIRGAPERYSRSRQE